MTEETKKSKGGRRPGAGRKPRGVANVRKCEAALASALPEVVEKLVELAKNGDKQCCLAIFHYAFGKPRQRKEKQTEEGIEINVGGQHNGQEETSKANTTLLPTL